MEIISGPEEARLIHLGVQARWPQPDKRVLIVDVGGGSAELILSEDGVLSEAFSKPLGAVRLTEVFLKSDPPAPVELHRMNESIEEKLATPRAAHRQGPVRSRYRDLGHRRRHRLRRQSRGALAPRGSGSPESFQPRKSASSISKSASSIWQDAARFKGIGPRRAELIVAGAAVFLRVLELFQQPALHYSAAGVRDGIIADLAARGVGRELSMLNRDQRRVVEQMARRYGVEIPHARKVAELAHRLFESLQQVHRLPPALGKLLEASAYLHDIGHYVSDTAPSQAFLLSGG